jgi:hypothetical protein
VSPFRLGDIVQLRRPPRWVGVVEEIGHSSTPQQGDKRQDPWIRVRLVLTQEGQPQPKHVRAHSTHQNFFPSLTFRHYWPRDEDERALISLWADLRCGWSVMQAFRAACAEKKKGKDEHG